MNWDKRPDCIDCKQSEAAIVWIGRPVCFKCFKKDEARQLVIMIKENLTKDELKEIFGGE